MKYLIDTNVLIYNADAIDEFEHVVICNQVLEELDGLKKDSGELGYRARTAIKKLDKSNVDYIVCDEYDMPLGWDKSKRDNQIIMCALMNKLILVSDDINVIIKCKSLNVNCQKYIRSCEILNKGFKIIEMDQEEMALWYENECKPNIFDLMINEYLLIKAKGEDKIVDHWVWTNKGFRSVASKKIDSMAFGKIKLLDSYQMCVVDSLFNNSVTMIKGGAGTGKSFLTIAYALHMIEKGKLDKLIVFANPLNTRNSAKLGFYPGSRIEKLMDSFAGHMLASKLGHISEVEKLIRENKLDILPFSDIRGFDTTGMKALIWIVEAQNLDIELMKLAIQRIGNDCQLVIDGDYDAQVDLDAFCGKNNGMKRVSEVFFGEEFYGEIELQNVYRSIWTERANRL